MPKSYRKVLIVIMGLVVFFVGVRVLREKSQIVSVKWQIPEARAAL